LTKVVLNSSVLIALSATGHLDKLGNVFEEPLVARAVYEEICVKGHGLLGDAELSEAVKRGPVKVRDVKNRVTVNALVDPLGLGEAETIALTVEENADYVVLDDRLARRRAKSLGLKVIGTLRVLRMMLEYGLMEKEELVEALEKLGEIGFRISSEVVKEALRDL